MTTNTEQLLREALHKIKYEAVSLADAQVIALEALTQPAQAGEAAALVPLATHSRLTMGPAPWTSTRVPLDAWDLSRAVYGTSTEDDEKRLYRSLQGAIYKLTTPPASQEQAAQAWDEGYHQGVADERTSEANIGVAGFGAKVEPARQNPYRTTSSTRQEQAKWTDADSDAARLALELECLLLDTKDTAAVSRWWSSALEALELHRARINASQEQAQQPSPCWQVRIGGGPWQPVQAAVVDGVTETADQTLARIKAHVEAGKAPRMELRQQPSGGEVVAWMWQHDETGRTGFVDRWQVENGWQEQNPRLKLIHALTLATTKPEPMTRRQQCAAFQASPAIRPDFFAGIRAAEVHHGITSTSTSTKEPQR